MTYALNLVLYNKHMLTSLDWSNTLPSEKLFSLCSVLKSVAYPSVKTIMKYLEKLFNPLELTGLGKRRVLDVFQCRFQFRFQFNLFVSFEGNTSFSCLSHMYKPFWHCSGRATFKY